MEPNCGHDHQSSHLHRLPVCVWLDQPTCAIYEIGSLRSNLELDQPWTTPSKQELVVFPQTGIAGFPAKTKLLLQPTDDGWQLIKPRWFLPPKVVQLSKGSHQMEMQSGMLLNSVSVSGDHADKLLFSKRYARHLDKLAELVNVQQSDATFEVDLRADFARA